MDRTQISEAVQKAVVEAVGAEPEEVVPEATLLDELGAESIDLLDILFRLERSIGVKIQAAQLAEYVQGGIPDDEFGDENEIITERGLAQLKRVMPQIVVAELSGRLQATQVMGLFTVDNLVDLVVTQVEAAAATAAA
ncbi:phosphopantetheine-binding protein [Streptomyces sp. NBS 14/10]|uniref:acyl carrier protein n=1 Tax=Streptomyces sp. NBS 14/10 TaxID=1945643 RepID=UPI000B7FF48A|nr:phosphopantetheine-binding protein [Streptomyces sp. NBS 14/10]KAK1183263.1 phosphopantetheine-binding protein [Streptomyces sp. NBS 14/10]NUS81731.1 acyl carrier protein [Streptomyces sp.]